MRLPDFLPMRKCSASRFFSGGFTLLEVIFAVAIFSFGITYASRNLIQSMRQKSELNTRSAAYYLAAGKVEEAIAGDGINAFQSGIHDDILWEREFKASSVEGMSEVVVVVKWTESGRDNTFFLRTLIRD